MPTILVVDDTPENITVLGQLLQPHYHVRVATSGPRALAASQLEPRPDLVLLDIMMPEMDGYAVLQHLRERQATRDVPVIFVSALDEAEDESRGLAMGASDYITKPIRPAIVLARVQAQLELKRARDRMADENAWLEGEVVRRMHENQLVQDAAMRALASLAEARDNETGNHIVRTQRYMELLCRQLVADGHYVEQLEEMQISLIVKAAPLHDIGKVGIPDHILLKPGKLTEDEWEIMRTHPTIGAQAIERAIRNEPLQAAFDFLRVAMDIARSHHEKWNGSGYPAGLCGEAIPLAARLMALADVFDALVNRRVYKSAWSFEEAESIISEGSGTHFDPRVVEAFKAQREAFRQVAERYRDQEADG